MLWNECMEVFMDVRWKVRRRRSRSGSSGKTRKQTLEERKSLVPVNLRATEEIARATPHTYLGLILVIPVLPAYCLVDAT